MHSIGKHLLMNNDASGGAARVAIGKIARPLYSYHMLERLSLREQATIRNQWLHERLKTILPQVMARANIDMWLVIGREYNEGPVIMTLLPQPDMSARRRTILLFHRSADGSIDTFSVSRYPTPGFYDTIWDPEQESQYACLARVIRERDPQRIGVNVSEQTAFADGLSQTEYALLIDALDEPYRSRVVSAHEAAVGWLETRSTAELTAYPRIVAMGHEIIAQAFSSEVIHPGITTVDDVVWWMRQTMADRGLQAWFQPTIMIQAKGEPFDPFHRFYVDRKTIMPGDLLHCDMGFYYMGLATDQQEHAYVLHAGESDAPVGLKALLATGNQLQDLHMAEFVVGRTGNEVLKETLAAAEAAGIDAMIYSHPLGNHGHAAGPIIGMWDQQGGVPHLGDYRLHNNTCYSVELNLRRAIPEWDNQVVYMMLEQDAKLQDGEMCWLNGRQTHLHLIS